MIVVPETLLIDAKMENLRLRAAIAQAANALRRGSHFEALSILDRAIPDHETESAQKVRA